MIKNTYLCLIGILLTLIIIIALFYSKHNRNDDFSNFESSHETLSYNIKTEAATAKPDGLERQIVFDGKPSMIVVDAGEQKEKMNLTKPDYIDISNQELINQKGSQNIIVKGKAEKEYDVKNYAIFINAALSDLENKNIPVGNRTTTIQENNGEVIVTFSPDKGARAGDFIVRIDKETGKILDTKIWR